VEDALRLYVEPELRGAPMLLAFEGWNDAGEAATSAVHYVEEAIRAVPLAEIDCEEFLDFTVRRPTVQLDDDGARVIEWPKAVFRYGSIDSSHVLVTGIGIEPHLRWRAFCDLVAGLVGRLRIERVVMLGAYLADVVYSRPVSVTGFATAPEILEELGVPPSGYQGATGIVGVLAERLHCEGVEVVSFWAALPHYISAAPNPRGALALVQKLSECIGMKLDEEPLRRDAADFEEKISALVASDPELAEYVRELKRRDFAQ
jgi:predicted ATP-grasp superfamily ATP-dependent carboligase